MQRLRKKIAASITLCGLLVVMGDADAGWAYRGQCYSSAADAFVDLIADYPMMCVTGVIGQCAYENPQMSPYPITNEIYGTASYYEIGGDAGTSRRLAYIYFAPCTGSTTVGPSTLVQRMDYRVVGVLLGCFVAFLAGLHFGRRR